MVTIIFICIFCLIGGMAYLLTDTARTKKKLSETKEMEHHTRDILEDYGFSFGDDMLGICREGRLLYSSAMKKLLKYSRLCDLDIAIQKDELLQAKQDVKDREANIKHLINKEFDRMHSQEELDKRKEVE